MRIVNAPGLDELVESLKGARRKSFPVPNSLVSIVAERTENFRPMPEGHALTENDWFAMSAKQRMDWRDRIAYPHLLGHTMKLIRARLSTEFEVIAVEDDPTPATTSYEHLADWICRIGIPKSLAETEDVVGWPNEYLRWNLDGIELVFERKSTFSDTLIFHVNAIYLVERVIRAA